MKRKVRAGATDACPIQAYVAKRLYTKDVTRKEMKNGN
jgi:hypothetical protein